MESENSRLERLKRSLYSRNEDSVPKEKRTPVSERSYTVPTNWGGKDGFDFSDTTMRKKNNSFFNKFFLASVIFFVLALGLAAFIFYGGFNMISSNNVDIEIAGPTSVSSGEELDLNLSVVNGNKVPLQNVKLSVNYPANTQAADGSGNPLTLDQFPLDTIGNGQVKNQSVRAILFGQKDSVQTITLQLEYTVAGSNAVFSKEKDYAVSISSAPLLLNVTYPQQINSGQNVTLSVDLTSNSSVVVSGALVKVLYPYGFTYESSSIKPARSLTLAETLGIATSTAEATNLASTTAATSTMSQVGALWSLGDLKSGDNKILTITGTLVGQDMEDRSFDVSVGVPESPGQLNFTSPLAEQLATIGISKPFFNLSLTNPLNGGQNFAPSGQSVSMVLGFQNTLPDKIVNSQITVSLSGNVFDPSQVRADSGGFYSSSNSSILWNKNTTDSLAEISPGDSGRVSFDLTPLVSGAQIGTVKNPHIDISATMSGSQTGTQTVDVSSTQNATFKFLSTLGLSAASYRNSGPFTNTGPIPPQADTESTYTITWTLTNTSNDLTGTTVSGTLPVGIVWKGQTAPASEHIAYDPDSRVVTWSVGDVSAGAGFTFSPRTVSFQVGVTPSLTQVGQSIDLLPSSTASATDTYVQSTISANAGDVTTQYSDPGFIPGDDRVVN
jgi:hypothetical protein